MSDGRWGERRWVRLAPVRRDDLKPVALALIDGPPFEVEFVGTMDEGPYDGQAMWQPVEPSLMPGVAWVPDCDLEEVAP